MATPTKQHSSKAVSQNDNGFSAIVGGGTSQVVALGASSTKSNQLGAGTTIVRLVSTVAAFVNFGGTGVVAAANTSIYLAPNVPEYFGVTPGSYIAGIQASGAGSLYITEGA